jgi:dual-specificity kinase
MSTPSTATATHPSYPRHYGYPGHQSYQPNPTLPPVSAADSSRFAPNPYPYAVGPSTTTLPFAQSARAHPSPLTPATMPSNQDGSSSGPPGQNHRRKKPDWGEFYRNGIPKEVIVIDDTPPPQPSKTASRGLPPAPAAANGVPQPSGKRRRTGLDTAYDLGYYDRPSYSNNPQAYGDNSSAASLSTDRTASLQTTAPTSLGSQGSSGLSNGVYFEDANVGQKRKRVNTRKSARDELKRRELETVGDAFLSYVPPPNPPVKAKDVPVPVVRDVS